MIKSILSRNVYLVILFLGFINAAFAHEQAKLQTEAFSSWIKNFAPSYFQEHNLRSSDLGIGKNQLVLTFDDGPTPHTLRLLKALIAYKMPATFFVVHLSVKNNPNAALEAFKTIKAHPELFTLANHSASHQSMTSSSFSTADWMRELFKVHNEVIIPFHTAELEPNVPYYYFRAPFGNFNWKISKFYNNLTTAAQKSAVSRYIGPVFWDMGGFYEKIQGKTTYIGDWTCWSKQFNFSVERCRDGHWKELLSFVHNPSRTSGVILLAHDLHKKTVDMFVGSSQFDDQGHLTVEDSNSLLAKINQLQHKSVEEGWGAPFKVVPLDINKTRTMFVRDFLPTSIKLPVWDRNN